MMRRRLYLLVLAALVAHSATAAVSVVNLPCGVRVQAEPVPNAVAYTFRRSVVNYCGEFFIVAMWIDALGSAQTPLLELPSTPSFSGKYLVDAIGSSGELLSTQETPWIVNEPARGLFHHPGSASALTALPGERLTIALGYSVPANSAVEWLRNGQVVQSGANPNLQWTVQQSDDGAVFVPRVQNACGWSDGYGRLVEVLPPPAGALVEWAGARTIDTLQVPGFAIVFGSCIGCFVPIVTRVEQSVPNAPCIAIDRDSFSTSCGITVSSYRTQSLVTRLQFSVFESVTLQLSGTNQFPVNQYNGPCGSVAGSLSGPVSASLPSTLGPWGPIEIELTPGDYVINTLASGSMGCYQGSTLSCGGPVSMQLTGQVRSHTLRVPEEFQTIQSAIDAVPNGSSRVVLVAPGIFHEGFSLHGKDVIVRGAANNATVIDGTGLATSIARFTGNEPATAGVENLVFRNGTAGTRPFPKATYTVGGGVYGVNSSAFIRNCRFEQNEAGAGGGVYLMHCAASVDGCLFAGNEALADGGGMLAYECSGAVRASDFTANNCGASGAGNGGAFKTVGALVPGGVFLLEDCSITATDSGVDGAAVHHFENSAIGNPGRLRIVDCQITGNTTVVGAGGIRHDGPQLALVLAGATTVCTNLRSDIDGPYLIEGAAAVCGCQADITGDGLVNGGDLGVLLSAWGLAGPLGTGDVNHDGLVNGADLSAVLGSWGGCH